MGFFNLKTFNYTLSLSIYAQIITAVIDTIALFIKVPNNIHILKELLILEYVVQFIEGSFYVWALHNVENIKNITPKRYYDWFITTPTMLVELVVYLIYLKNN